MSGKLYIPRDIDFRIGKNIQILRARHGLTQKDLGKILGVSFQQIQKYETAGNRISASHLYDIAHALGTPIGALYNESRNETMHTPEMLSLIQDIYKLSDADRMLLKKIIVRLKQ